MVSLHACRAQEMIGLQYPRAVELFGVSGGSAAAFSCLAAGADGGGTGTGDPKVEGKQAVGCAKGLAKAGRKFASAKLAVAQKCALAVSKCLQEKPADMACLPKARKTCAQQVGKITAPQGLRAKLVATVVRACDAPGLGIDATLASTGIGFGARAQLCAGLAVVNLATIADVAACLERQHECRVEQALEAELPRLRELLAIGGVALP
jgi:hypothetical protein